MTKNPAEQLRPVYLVLGDQPVLVDLEIRKIKRRVGKHTLDFNYDQFDGYQASGFEIVSAANTSPFMSDWRLVLVRNSDKLPKEDVSAIALYLESPSPTTCLVLLADFLSEKSVLYKAVSTCGEVILKNIERAKLPAMVKKGFERRDQIISDAVVRYLITVTGEDLTRLGNEIEKISLYRLGERVISLEDVRSVVSHSDEVKIFELSDRIGVRDAPGALRALEQLMQTGFERKYRPKGAASREGRTGRRATEGASDFRMVRTEEHALWILNMLAGHFRMLLRTKSMLEGGADGRRIIETLGIKGPDRTRNFLLGKYRQQSQNFALDELKKAAGLFVKADLTLKSTGQPPGGVLERLVVSLASL